MFSFLELDNTPPSIDYSRIKQQPYQVSHQRIFEKSHDFFFIRCHILIQAMIRQISIHFSLNMVLFFLFITLCIYPISVLSENLFHFLLLENTYRNFVKRNQFFLFKSNSSISNKQTREKKRRKYVEVIFVFPINDRRNESEGEEGRNKQKYSKQLCVRS